MTRSSRALMLAAAIAASLSMSGCGTPEFVYALCQESLSGTMADASWTGLSRVTTQCGSTFTARVQINNCIAEGSRVLQEAKDRTMPEFRDKCAEYVTQTVCVEGSKCYKDAEKITPALARPAVISYVNSHADNLQAEMATALDNNIKTIVTQNYDNKVRNRVVPLIVQAQCSTNLDQKMAQNMNLQTDPITAIYAKCTSYNRDHYFTIQCQNRAVEQLARAQTTLKDAFKKRCQQAALDAACPRGSECAIETDGANTEKTGQAVINFLWENYSTWETSYKASLMRTARGWSYFGRKFGNFTLPDWQGSALIGAMSFAAVVGGIGCITAALIARKRSIRSVNAGEATEAIELMDPEAIEE